MKSADTLKPTPALQFLTAVRALDRQMTAQLGAVDPAAPVDPEVLRQQLAAELPLLAAAPPAVDVGRFMARLGEYRMLIAEYRPELAGELARQARVLDEAGPETRRAVTTALLASDAGALYDLAEQLDLAPEHLLYVGQLGVRPCLAAYAAAIRELVDLSGYRGARCPICGSPPHLGHIDVENVKHLHCPACETTWRYNRVACVWCGCADTDHLGFFTVNGDDEHRVEHCSECRGYLKVVNQRVRSRPLDWLLEDAATLHLDNLAESEGYQRGAGQA